MESLSYYIGICVFITFVVLGLDYKNDFTTCKQKNGKCSKLDECCTRHGECCSHFCYKSFVLFNGICMDPTVVQKLITSRNKAKLDKDYGSSCTSDTDCKSTICFKKHAWNNFGVCKSSYDEEFDDDNDDNDDNDDHGDQDDDLNRVEYGLCSYYNPEGQITASGEPYNKYAYTAAHRTLPFNTLVRVNIGDLSFDVRINDRGPFDQEEIMLNLAYDVADRMHIVQQGMTPCAIRAVGTKDTEVDHRLNNTNINKYVEYGLCSYYNPEGQITASGEPYNKYAYTAAHRTLPFNTLVRVNIGDLSFDVRINDRGPFDQEEIMLNLAYDVADRMHIVQQGMTPCAIRAVGTKDAEVDHRLNNKKKKKNGNSNKDKKNSNKHKNNGDNCKQLWSNTCLNDKECCSNYCEKKDPKKATGVCKKQTR